MSWFHLVAAGVLQIFSASTLSAQDIRRPGVVRWGATIMQVREALARRCSRIVVRRIDPPFLTAVREQMQIDCENFSFWGKLRHAEFVIGDDSLEMVWIVIARVERKAALRAMIAAYGPPSGRHAGMIGFLAFHTALRRDPDEILFYSRHQAEEWRGFYRRARRTAAPPATGAAK